MSQANTVQIRNIQVNEFALVALKEQLPANINFNFEVNFAYSIAGENNVNVLTTVTISGGEKKTIFARMQSICGYVVNQPEFAKQDSEGKVILEKELAQDLNAISLSTTRGLLFSNLRGTYLHNAILPIINMNAVKQQ